MSLAGNENFDTVLVTGFGVFRTYNENPSWQVAQELEKMDFSDSNIRLAVSQVPVEYLNASKIIPELWEKHKPKLVVHMGVSPIARHLTVETCARRVGYKNPDVVGNTPKNHCCELGRDIPDCCFVKLDVESAVSALNEKLTDAKFVLSKDAGLYLCEYVFFTSLNIDCSRTIFVHVPDPDKASEYNIPKMANAIRALINLLMTNIRNSCE